MLPGTTIPNERKAQPGMSYKEEVEKLLRSRPRRQAGENASPAQVLEVLVDNHHEAILELQAVVRKLAEELDAKSGDALAPPSADAAV